MFAIHEQTTENDINKLLLYVVYMWKEVSESGHFIKLFLRRYFWKRTFQGRTVMYFKNMPM